MDFKQQLQNDFNVMLDGNYFGVSCLNTRTNLSFDVIFSIYNGYIFSYRQAFITNTSIDIIKDNIKT